MSKEKTESVRVPISQVDRIRKFVAAKPYTIGGYIADLIKKDMDKIDNRKASKK